jgi:hypothetical protein
LAKDSIYKSLVYCVQIDVGEMEESRNMSAAACALREMFLHGRQDFQDFRDLLMRLRPHERWATYEELDLVFEYTSYSTWTPDLERIANVPEPCSQEAVV